MRKYLLLFVLILLISLSALTESYCQNSNKKVIQLTGLVVGGDSSYGIPGVYFYVPKSGRGTASNYLGYFSLPVLVGDSLVVKALGFKEKHFIIPEVEEKLSVVIQLLEDTSFLPTVEVFPWPTEKIFKEAFLSLQLPEQEIDNMNKNISEKVMARMMLNVPDDGSLNHRFFMQQQIQRGDGRFYYPTFNPINPFAWSRFIKSAKNGGLKYQEDKEKEKNKDD